MPSCRAQSDGNYFNKPGVLMDNFSKQVIHLIWRRWANSSKMKRPSRTTTDVAKESARPQNHLEQLYLSLLADRPVCIMRACPQSTAARQRDEISARGDGERV